MPAIGVPWPVTLLGTLLGVLVILASAIAVIRATGYKANLELLRSERDDYKAAYEHADEEREKCQRDIEAQQRHYEKELAVLSTKIETLSNVVSGTTAVKELGDLLITVLAQGQAETRAGVDSIITMLRTGGPT